MVEKPGVAEEMTQDVFMTLWNRGSSYKNERGSFTAWLLSVTHNRSIDELRESRRQAKLPTVEIDEAAIVAILHAFANLEVKGTYAFDRRGRRTLGG